jgi:predicted AAA+ superfamily ATPase
LKQVSENISWKEVYKRKWLLTYSTKRDKLVLQKMKNKKPAKMKKTKNKLLDSMQIRKGPALCGVLMIGRSQSGKKSIVNTLKKKHHAYEDRITQVHLELPYLCKIFFSLEVELS